MPGFAALLSDDERWDLIDYIRAHNAGTTMDDTGAWSPPVQAPELQATCGGRTVTLHDLRGRFVRLVIGETALAATNPDVVTIAATSDATPVPTSACIADDETVPLAYSLVSGIPKQDLPGTQWLCCKVRFPAHFATIIFCGINALYVTQSGQKQTLQQNLQYGHGFGSTEDDYHAASCRPH